MSQKKNTVPVFVGLEYWKQYLPEAFRGHDESYWTVKTHRGMWPMFCRRLGQKSEAVWRASDILAAFREHWGALHPDAIQSLLDAGFTDADTTPSEYPRTRKQKANGAKKKGRRNV